MRVYLGFCERDREEEELRIPFFAHPVRKLPHLFFYIDRAPFHKLPCGRERMVCRPRQVARKMWVWVCEFRVFLAWIAESCV